MFLISFGARSAVPDEFLSKIRSALAAGTMDSAVLMLIFRNMEQSGHFNAGMRSRYKAAVGVCVGGRYDAKFDFQSRNPSQVALANLVHCQLPAFSFGHQVQSFCDYLEDGDGAEQLSGQQCANGDNAGGTDTIGLISTLGDSPQGGSAASATPTIISSTGMSQNGRIPPTVMPYVGFGEYRHVQFITTGFGEFLQEYNALSLLAVLSNLNFTTEDELPGGCCTVLWRLGPTEITVQRLLPEQCALLPDRVNYFYLEGQALYCLARMEQTIIVGNVDSSYCILLRAPVRILLGSAKC